MRDLLAFQLRQFSDGERFSILTCDVLNALPSSLHFRFRSSRRARRETSRGLLFQGIRCINSLRRRRPDREVGMFAFICLYRASFNQAFDLLSLTQAFKHRKSTKWAHRISKSKSGGGYGVVSFGTYQRENVENAKNPSFPHSNTSVKTMGTTLLSLTN